MMSARTSDDPSLSKRIYEKVGLCTCCKSHCEIYLFYYKVLSPMFVLFQIHISCWVLLQFITLFDNVKVISIKKRIIVFCHTLCLYLEKNPLFNWELNSESGLWTGPGCIRLFAFLHSEWNGIVNLSFLISLKYKVNFVLHSVSVNLNIF